MSVTAHPKTLATPARPLEWKWLALALATLLAVYLSMLNRYWVPSGDGEVYTCIARSLVQVNKLLFNGAKAAIAPPGWPLVLSWLMRISPEFWFLKLAIILSMVGGFASAFFIVRRFVSDRAAAGIIVLTGILSSVYPLTYWTHTESFFCLLGFAAILIAFRISEGRARLWWEVPAMLALLGFGSFTRWPGVLHAVLVIPILFSGAKRRPWERRSAWIYAAAIVIVCGGTLVTTHNYLRLSKAEQQYAIGQGATPEGNPEEEIPTETQPPLTTEPVNAVGSENTTPGLGDVMTQSKRGPVAEIFYRVGTSGRWFSWLLWQPTRFGQSVGFVDASSLFFGWLSIVLLFVTTIRAAKRRDFFWIGLALYTGGLCVLWPNPNARYFVPVAPFIVLGVLRGIRETSAILRERASKLARGRGFAMESAPVTSVAPIDYIASGTKRVGPVLPPLDMGPLHPACKGLTALFVVVTLLINLPLLGIDICIFRSAHFYEKYEAGANLNLLQIAAYINTHPLPDGEMTSVYERYENMGRIRYSKFGVRAMHLLCNMQILPVDRKTKFLKQDPADEDFRRSLRRAQASYVITQEPWTPWRVWHFRLSREFQQRLQKSLVGNDSGGWELWVRFGARYHRSSEVPKTYIAPTRVPGL